MNEREARLLLQACRPGEEDRSDPQIAEALLAAHRDPELACWLSEEQAFDRAVAAHLDALPVPFGLKTRILAQAAPPATTRASRWLVGLAGVAALLFLLSQVVDLGRNPARGGAAGPLPGYASEMVSFIKLDPPLEMESPDLGAIAGWLGQREAPMPEVPPHLAALQAVGCRVLSYRGHKVTLLCFHREGGRLAHLFVVERAALPGLKTGAAPFFHRDGEWTTASWVEKDRAYMIAAQGDEATLRHFLPDA